MTGQEFISLCEPWWNADNLFNENPTKEIQTNNGVSYSAEYHAILALLPSPTIFRGAMRTSIIHTIDPCEMKPGLYRRSPTSDLDNAHDDHHAVAAMSSVTAELDYAERIATHGATHGWCYNVKDPETYTERLDHSRHIGVIQHYIMATKKPLSIIDQALWAISMCIPGSHSGNRMKWQRYLTHKRWPHKTVLTITGALVFQAWFKRRYSKGLVGEMYANHFDKHGRNHPFSIAMWGKME